MVNSSIRCTVANCVYHDKKDYCTASEIMVSTDGLSDGDSYTSATDCACGCTSTCCQTFKEK